LTLPPQYETPRDVAYLMSRLYWHDLQEALQTLKLMRRLRRPHTRFCLLRDFVVSYCRPFSENRAPLIRTHRLGLRFVPIPNRALHAELLTLRSQVFAHTDFEYHRPRVSRWVTARGPYYPMTIRTATYTALLNRVDELRDLASGVQQRVAEFQKRWEADNESEIAGSAA
jgi:hypothetical protein